MFAKNVEADFGFSRDDYFLPAWSLLYEDRASDRIVGPRDRGEGGATEGGKDGKASEH